MKLIASLLVVAAATVPTSMAGATHGGSGARSVEPTARLGQSGATLPADSAVCQGSTVAVPVEISPADGGLTMDFVIAFDPTVVQPTNVLTSAITAGCHLVWNVAGAGLDHLAIGISCDAPRAGSGPVAYVYLQGIASSGSSALHWLTANLNNLPVTPTTDGSVSITSGSSSLRMTSATGGLGGIVDIPLLGNLAPSSIGINAEVHWDPTVLSGVTVTLAPGLPPDWSIDYVSTAGSASISIFGTTPISGVQTLASNQFTVIGGAGSSSPLDLTLGDVNELPACLTDGTFYVCPPCDDGNACNGVETCSPTRGCVAGVPVVCAPPNQCQNAGTCDPGTGGCTYTNKPNGTACDDGNACTSGDVCDAGVCNSGATITAPPETQNVAVAADKATYSWSVAAFATRYDVVRGSAGALPVGPGGGDEICFDNLAGTSLVDAAVPSPGAVFWYLSRGENSCGQGTYGTQGVHGAPGAPRSTTTCP